MLGPRSSPPPPGDAVLPAGVRAAPTPRPAVQHLSLSPAWQPTEPRGPGWKLLGLGLLHPLHLWHIDGHGAPALPAGQSLGVCAGPGFLPEVCVLASPARPPSRSQVRAGAGPAAPSSPRVCIPCLLSQVSRSGSGRRGRLPRSLTPEPFGLNSWCRRWGPACWVDSWGPGNTSVGVAH